MRKIENKISVQFATGMLIKQASHPPNSSLTIGKQAGAVYFSLLVFQVLKTRGSPSTFPEDTKIKKTSTHRAPKIEPGDYIFLTDRSVRDFSKYWVSKIVIRLWQREMENK